MMTKMEEKGQCKLRWVTPLGRKVGFRVASFPLGTEIKLLLDSTGTDVFMQGMLITPPPQLEVPTISSLVNLFHWEPTHSLLACAGSSERK